MSSQLVRCLGHSAMACKSCKIFQPFLFLTSSGLVSRMTYRTCLTLMSADCELPWRTYDGNLGTCIYCDEGRLGRRSHVTHLSVDRGRKVYDATQIFIVAKVKMLLDYHASDPPIDRVTCLISISAAEYWQFVCD